MPLVQSAFHIFQSTLPREERRNAKTSYSIRDNFNPRSHERSDVRSNNLTILLHNFNPRSHERSDKEIESSLTAGKFQSTLPREERRIRCIFTLIFRNFNPRSHERSDHIQRAFRQTCHISIHAPTRGATQLSLICIFSPIFQSTLPREERHSSFPSLILYTTISIHAPTRGATISCVSTKSSRVISIHAPTRGATKHHFPSLCIHCISIHAPTRGATILPLLSSGVLPFQSTLPREERQQYCTKNLFIFIQYRQ